jgi:HK97 family phage portal protein
MIAPNHRILWLPGEERMWDEDASSRTAAGIRIDASNALQVSAVFACLRVLAETIASLPLHVLERLERGSRRASELPLYRRLHQQPNDWQTSFEWREQAVFHIGLWGDAYSEIRSGASGAVDQLIPLHPSRMTVERMENGRLRYKYREESGRETVYSQDAILHMRGPSDDGVHGMSVVESCKDAIALARACELHGARFFGNGARPGFVLSTENELNAEAREALRAGWERMHGGVNNSNRTAVLVGGLKPIEIPQASMHDSQFIEARKWQLSEIARLFRVPLHLLGAETSPGSVEHAGLDYVQHTILPWLRRFESAFQRDLIVDDDRYFVEFDVRGLMRGDAASRSAYYRQMWDIGALSTNDILELENRNPVEGGDERYRPLNMGTLGAPPSVDDVLAQQQPGSEIDGQAVEGGVAAAEEVAPEPVVEEIVVEEPEPQVAEVSLNGAQITGLITIIQTVADGLVTREAAAAMIAASFPSISPAQIEAILAGVVERQPEPAAVEAQPPQEPDVAPTPASEPEEARAEPGTVVEGDFVSWGSAGGRARGRIDHVMDYGSLDVPGTDFAIEATEQDPAALITVYEEVSGGWRPTETQVGHKLSTLTKIDPLPEPPPVEEAGWKGKRKPRRRGRGT